MSEQAPNESKFKAMEIVAAAQGPEAEARRREMAHWAEAQGEHAEAASRINKAAEDNARELGLSHEQTKKRVGDASERIAKFGTVPLADRGNGVRVRATEQGIVRELDDSVNLLRSPAHINETPAQNDKIDRPVHSAEVPANLENS